MTATITYGPAAAPLLLPKERERSGRPEGGEPRGNDRTTKPFFARVKHVPSNSLYEKTIVSLTYPRRQEDGPRVPWHHVGT